MTVVDFLSRVMLVGVMAITLITQFVRIRRHRTVQQIEEVSPDPSQFLGWFLGIASIAAASHWLIRPMRLAGETPDGVRWIGLLLVIAGLILWYQAVRALGPNWIPGVAVRNQHRLVTHGPYRYVRHPMYSAFLLIGLGMGLAAPAWIIGIYVGLPYLAYLLRIPAEERMLRERFPRQWDQYAEKTGVLFPKWRQ